jgi:hypothetical protein
MGTEVKIEAGELERLRRIEAAATDVLRQWDGTKASASPMLEAIAGLRAAMRAGAA